MPYLNLLTFMFRYTKYNGSKKHYLAKSVDWGLGLNKNHATPGGTLPYNGFSLKKYNTIFTGNTKK